MRAFTYGVGRNAAVVLVALGTVACTALLGDFNVGADGTSGGLGEGGTEGGGSDAEGPPTIMPAEVKVGVLRGQTFTTNLPVTWSVQEGPSGGIIDEAGKYIAPDKPAVVHVIATSKTDPKLTATATVTVAPLGISILNGASGGEGNIDGPPLRAHFRQPGGIAHLFENGGGERYFIADTGNHTIRVYDTLTQKVSTLAGTSGTPGRTDGTGAAAQFRFPRQLIADRKRHLIYVLDSDGTCIRQVDPATSAVTTVTGTCGTSGASDGGVGLPATFNAIRSFDINGGKFDTTTGDALMVCDGAQRIRKVSLVGTSRGNATTIVNTSGCDLATDMFSNGFPEKNIYFVDGTTLKRFQDLPPYPVTPLGPAPEFYSSGMGVASGQGPEGLYFVSESHSVVYRSTPIGAAFETTPFLGAVDDDRVIDGPFMTARIGRPNGIDVITERGNGSLLIADNEAAAIRSADLGTKKVTTMIGAARMQDRVDGPRSAARLTGPFGITSDASGIYFTDIAFDSAILNNTIRKIEPSGAITTVAGKPAKPSTTVPPVDGTKNEATFGFPIDIVSLKGNLYVIDIFGQAVRKVTAAGDVTTIAGELGVSGGTADGIGAAAHFKFADIMAPDGVFGGGVTTDGTDLYVTDSANFAIRKITVATGQVTLIAGGTKGSENGIGPAAHFINPWGLTYDNGFLYIADSGDHTIRRLDLKTKEVTGFMGLSGLFGDKDGDAVTALFHSPARIQADALGNLFVVDLPFSSNTPPGVIRRIDIKTRTVSTYAGMRGQAGLAPGPLPSTLNCALSFTVLPSGDLGFADFCESSIAVIRPL